MYEISETAIFITIFATWCIGVFMGRYTRWEEANPWKGWKAFLKRKKDTTS